MKKVKNFLMITEKKIFIKIKSIKKFLLYWEKSGKMEKRRSQLLEVLRSSISRMSHELKKSRKKIGKFGKISMKRTRLSFSQI